MTKSEVLEKVQGIIRDHFDDESLDITPETVAADVDDWDSLEHINLITRMEKEFSIRFTMKEAAGFKNVGDMIDTILRKL
ncbi:MAG: acyl carrier protein [Clostridiales bacterium]|nr:acyl carrier protein [Clostridiales bacterium]MBP3941509.1 acyl carrier protein [Christensenellaceae bacterium]MBR2223008.1 acyl carrier protein [Christensenellaceae bacterium]MBR3842329.1 acyl carrier protein [Christensenellaceae bacterium]